MIEQLESSPVPFVRVAMNTAAPPAPAGASRLTLEDMAMKKHLRYTLTKDSVNGFICFMVSEVEWMLNTIDLLAVQPRPAPALAPAGVSRLTNCERGTVEILRNDMKLAEYPQRVARILAVVDRLAAQPVPAPNDASIFTSEEWEMLWGIIINKMFDLGSAKVTLVPLLSGLTGVIIARRSGREPAHARCRTTHSGARGPRGKSA